MAVLTLVCYWPVRLNEFVRYDDQDYVTENSQVLRGLSWQGVAWAFRTGIRLTGIQSPGCPHMLDVQLFGLDPAGHHVTNLVLHTANALVLLLLLHRLTGALGRSALVAALFAVHPLHVESVAWVAERKDVLSTLFGLLSLWAYVGYAKESRTRNHESRFPFHVSGFYVLALLLFAMSLLSKPMLVTLPLLMLLLDYWPLRRAPARTLSGTLSDTLSQRMADDVADRVADKAQNEGLGHSRPGKAPHAPLVLPHLGEGALPCLLPPLLRRHTGRAATGHGRRQPPAVFLASG